jgi:signal transduction histidine kinase
VNEDEPVAILLVDDQPSRLLSYHAILADLGCRLVDARSGDEALERLMADEFAVILLDVSMPGGMDGFETAAMIHRHPRHEKTPIVFVTAHHVADLDHLRGYALGAVDYVYVPVVPQLLRNKVAVLVEIHRSRRRLEGLNRSLEQANAELARSNTTLQSEKAQQLARLHQDLSVTNTGLAETNATLQAEIIERRRLEEALREVDRQKDQFLAMLAHELRNPLAPIVNAVHFMGLKDCDDELRWCHDVIQRQAEHLTRLVEDLLDVSRISHGKIKLQRRPLDMAEVVERAVESCRPFIDAKRHAFTVMLPSTPAWVNGDAVRLTQVVANLVHNAAKYTEDGGRIRLSLERDAHGAGEVIVRVRDSGVGIATDMLARVFDLFTQVERTVDRAEGGLGIGLALVRHLVELHGGSVAAASDGPQRGAEFVVRLPGIAAPRDAAVGPSRPAIKAPAAAGLRVLVVDDNRDSAKTMSFLVRRMGHQVRTAFDGGEAIEAAVEFHPDVVLLDLGLPVVDGFEAARRIRATSADPPILVALTGWGQEEDRRRTKSAGFDHHLVKPIDRRTLQGLLDGIVSMKHAPA